MTTSVRKNSTETRPGMDGYGAMRGRISDVGRPSRLPSIPDKAVETGGFTLFEIILALAIGAVILAAAVPYLSESFGRSPADEASDLLAQTVRATRASALEKGEARRLSVFERGLKPDLDSLPAAELPAGWKLEIQRMTESKFHKPGKKEVWEFNAAGISEPVTFRLTSERETTTVSFDPLTGLIVNEQ